jgi:ATP-dependent helicase/nuclease subunit B
VTEVETWIRDPYAIYAKHVLHLKPLNAIEQEAGPPERGNAIHRALERFLNAFPGTLPGDGLDELLRIGKQAFVEMGAGPATLALWMPRFERAARWFVHYQSDRRRRISRSFVEVKGSLSLKSALPFELRGRADRIDLFPDGQAAILDYKSGRAPSKKQMENLLSPQLALEGAMLLEHAFGEIAASGLKEFVHVRLTGGDPPGQEQIADLDANASAAKAGTMLHAMVARYENPATAYVSWALRERVTDKGDYDHLARVLEWSAGDEADE